MILVHCNQQYALFSNQTNTTLIQLGSFKTLADLPMQTKIGHLQYATGIAALVTGSKVRIYDFLFARDVYDYESYLKILAVGLLKNLLIVISSERILIHDLKARTNKCYIPIEQGELAFFSSDYYALKIAYYTESHLLSSRELWLNKVKKIEGVKYCQAAYSANAQHIALVIKNVLSIYCDSTLMRVYGFDSDVVQLVPLGPYFFVKLDDGMVIGCGADKQVNFLQCQEIALEFWQHEHETVLLAGKDELYEMGKGLVRKYRLQTAQECQLSESKNMKRVEQ